MMRGRRVRWWLLKQLEADVDDEEEDGFRYRADDQTPVKITEVGRRRLFFIPIIHRY